MPTSNEAHEKAEAQPEGRTGIRSLTPGSCDYDRAGAQTSASGDRRAGGGTERRRERARSSLRSLAETKADRRLLAEVASASTRRPRERLIAHGLPRFNGIPLFVGPLHGERTGFKPPPNHHRALLENLRFRALLAVRPRRCPPDCMRVSLRADLLLLTNPHASRLSWA